MSTTRFIPFTQEADEFAVAWLLAFRRGQPITSEQLTCAMYQLGRIASVKEPRGLSFQKMERRTRWSRKFCRTVNQMLQDAGLIEVASTVAGKPASFVLGPEFNGESYLMEVERWQNKWREGVHWPFTSLSRTASRAAKVAAKAAANAPATPDPELPPETGVGPQRTQGVGPLGTQGGGSTENPPRGGSTENPGGGSTENPPLILIESSSLDIPLEKAIESETAAEVEPQASGLTASSPAEISEQPNSQEQPDQQQEPGELGEVEMAEWQTAQRPTAAISDGLVVSSASPATALDQSHVEQGTDLVAMMKAVKAEALAKREWWEMLDEDAARVLTENLLKAMQGHWLHDENGMVHAVLDGYGIDTGDGVVRFPNVESFRGWFVTDSDGAKLSILNDVAKAWHSSSLVEA